MEKLNLLEPTLSLTKVEPRDMLDDGKCDQTKMHGRLLEQRVSMLEDKKGVMPHIMQDSVVETKGQIEQLVDKALKNEDRFSSSLMTPTW